jgi:two-component system, response regulator
MEAEAQRTPTRRPHTSARPELGSGGDVLKRLRADERTTLMPIAVLNSSNEESDRHRSYVAGVNAYVVKPVEFGNCSDALMQLGLFWLVINEPPRYSHNPG